MNCLVERLFSSIHAPRVKRDLNCIKKIDDWLGCLHRRFLCIHIAGTNGKGSVSLKIASGLQASGKKVGLYTSPHIDCFRERIRILSPEGEEVISKEFIEGFLPDFFRFLDREKLEPTFFEQLTALGLAYFAFRGVDAVVLETGLGGACDATNIVDPILSVITSIDYDHQDVLGQTLEEIAHAKAGIIKPEVPVVIGPHARIQPILDAAGSRALFAPETKGFYDRENSSIARTALEFLGISQEAISIGIEKRPPCRFEVIGCRPIIFDAAHNPNGFSRLAEALHELNPNIAYRLALALGRGKDPMRCIQPLLKHAIEISCICNDHPRLYSGDELADLLQSQGQKQAKPVPFKEIFSGNMPVVVAGSFFILADAKRALSG